MTKKFSPNPGLCAENDNIVEFPQSRPEAPKDAPKSPAVTDQLNRNELVSIKALTSYVAYNKNVPENVVSAFMQAEFKVSDVADLRRQDYERVIKFLVDLRADLLVN
jgi:hypothetical protein